MSLEVEHSDECIGFRRPLIVSADNSGAAQLVIYPTVYANQPKATVWRVLAYDASNRSFCYAPDASVRLTKAAGMTPINDSNARSILEGLHLPAAFKCAVLTKID